MWRRRRIFKKQSKAQPVWSQQRTSWTWGLTLQLLSKAFVTPVWRMLADPKSPYPRSPVVPVPSGLKTLTSSLVTAQSAPRPERAWRAGSPSRSICLQTGIILKLLTHLHTYKKKNTPFHTWFHIKPRNRVPALEPRRWTSERLPLQCKRPHHTHTHRHGKVLERYGRLRQSQVSPGNTFAVDEAAGFCLSSSFLASVLGSGTRSNKPESTSLSSVSFSCLSCGETVHLSI